MSFPHRRLAHKVAIDELKDGWGGATKGPGTEGWGGWRKMDFSTRSGSSNIKFITFPNNGGGRKDCRLFSVDNVHSGSLNGGFN